jgi:hypothetical protein
LQKPNPFGPNGLYHEILKIVIDFGRDISASTECVLKSFPRWFRQRRNRVLVCSADDEIRSAYAQLILNDGFETVVISSYAERAQKLVTRC